MDLDELKIKVSIELEDLNKQLDAITKGIDKALGPKATKKLMKSNHKIVKTESAAINKELNKAFEVDFKKFNTSLKDSMNQAKQVVRQTCREIRNELNAALNVRGSIRVTGKASVSNSYSSRGSSDSSAIIQSSQYTGAMINKAVNEMIKANNANTARIESALRDIASKLDKINTNSNKQNIQANSRGNATHKQDINANAIIETTFKVIDDELQSNVDKAVRNIKTPSIEVPIDVDTSKVDNIEIPDTYESEVQLTVNDNDIQGAINQIINSVDIPELNASLDLLDNGVQEQINQIIDSIDIPEIVVEVRTEDNGIQYEIESIVNSVDVPEIAINVTAKDDDVQNAVDDIVESVDVPELTVQLLVEDDSIQNEVDDVVRAIDIPELFIDFKVNQNNIQIKVNEAISKLRIPKVEIPLKPKTVKAKQESKIDQGKIKTSDEALNANDFLNADSFMHEVGLMQKRINTLNIQEPISFERASKEAEQLYKNMNKVYSVVESMQQVISAQMSQLGGQAETITFSNASKDLTALVPELENIINKAKELAKVLKYTDFDIDSSKALNGIVQAHCAAKRLMNDIQGNIKIPEIEMPEIEIDDSWNELSITIDNDDIFGEMSEVVNREVQEIENSLKRLNTMYKSMFNRSVIGESFKYDLNVANDSLDRTHKKLESLKDYIYNFGGFTNIDTDNLEQKDITPSLTIDDNESFSDFGDRINNEIDSISKNLKHLNMRYTSLFNSSEKGSSFEYDINLANNSLKETIKTVEKLSVSLQKLKDYAGFQNKFDAPDPAGAPMLQSDSLNELGQWFEDTIKLSNNINELKDALQELFVLLNTPVDVGFDKTIGEAEKLQNKISDILSTFDLGHGLDSFKDKIDENSDEIEQSIENIIVRVAKLCNSMDEVSNSGSGADIRAFKELENIDSAVLEEIARLEKSIAEDEARRIAIIAELEKGYKHLKEDLSDIKNMTDEEFELEFDLDETKEDLAKARKELLSVRETFKNINRESNIEIDVKTIRDCISLIEKLQAKIDKIEAANAKLEKENAPKPEKVKAPKEAKEKEPKPTKPDDLLQKEKDVKLLKDYLLDIKALSDEDFKIDIESSDSSMRDLLGAKESLKNLREEFRDFNANNELQFNLGPIRDCISLIDKLQERAVKLQTSEIKIGTKADKSVKIKPEKSEKPTKPEDFLALEKYIKLYKDNLVDLKSLNDEEFEIEIGIENFEDFRLELLKAKKGLFDFRDLFKEFNANNELQFNLAPIRDCISLIEKLQDKVDKIESAKIEPKTKEKPTKPTKPDNLLAKEKYIKLLKDDLLDLKILSDEEFELEFNLDDIKEYLDFNKKELKVFRELFKDFNTNNELQFNLSPLRDCLTLIDKLQLRIDKINESKIDLDVDTNKVQQAIKMVGSGNFSTRPGGPYGFSGGGGGGGRIVDSGSFDHGFTNEPIMPDPSDMFDTGDDFNAHIRTHYMGKLIDQFKELANKIKPIMKDLSNKIKDSLKGALSKLASASKSLWGKITSIFKKGARDSAKATNSLRDTVKDLARNFLSFYTIWNGAKMAIQSAEGLIQGEQKLTTVMKNRMKATDDSVRAINKLIDAQSQLGVVSKQVQYNASQQLAVFLQSSKALETLIPSMNDLIAQQYGANATLEEGSEVARKLGQAIVEGEFTELQESTGITLSEAEIEKFRSLATEEERAAYLAQILSDRIGNMNEQLANTPYGAITQLKNNFMELLGTVGALIVTAIKPLVQWLNQIVIACTKAIKAFGEFLGFSFDATSLGITGGGSVGEGVEDTKEGLEDATEAAEKFKGSLMGFDELNILTDNTNKNENTPPITDGSIAGGGEAFADDEGALDIMSDKMKAFLDEILEPFKKAWELLGDDLIAEWQDLKESFKHFCDSLGKFLVSVWEHGGKEFVQHLAEIGLACGIAAMEIGGEILDSLARLWDHLDPAKNMNTQGFLNALNEVSVKLRDFILGLGDHFESLMANGGQDVLNSMGDCFMNLGEAATRGFGVAIDALDGFIDHLDPAVNENTKNMLQSLADMFHAVGQTSLDFVSLLESCLVNGGQNMINAFGDMMMNMGQATSEVITTIMTSFSELFEYLDPATNEITKNMMKAWEDAFLAIGESSLAFSDLFESIMLNGGQEVLNKLGDAFNSLVGLVGTIVEEIADALTGLYEHLDPKTNEFTQNMLKNWQTAFENISDLCDTLGETLGSIMDNGGQDLLNSLGDLVMQISGTFGQLVGIVADSMSKFFEHMDPGKNSASKGAIDALTYTIDSIRDFIDVFGDSVQYFLDNGGQDFINNLGDIIALIADLGFTIAGDVISSITTFFDSWAGHLLIAACGEALEIVSTVLEALLELLEPLTPLLSGLLAGFAAFKVSLPIIGFITKLVAGFKTLAGAGGIVAVAKTALSGLWAILAANPIAATVAAIVGIGVALVACYNKFEWFRTIIDTVFGPLNKAFEAIVDTVIKVFDDVVDIFRNIIDIIVGIFTGDGQKVGNAVRELCGNILKLFGDIVVGIADIGWNIITGLVEGIWNGIKAIPTLLAGIGKFVVDFFKGLFGIHSPSTVFAEIGVNLIEGLVEGIVSMIGAISEGWQKIGDAIFDAITGIVTNSIENWGKLGKAIFDSLGDIYDNVSEKWGKIKENVSDKCKDIYEDTKEKWTNIKDKTIEIASNLK